MDKRTCKCKEFFKNWNYKKHATLVGGVYLVMFAIDMTLGYVVCKKALDKVQEGKG